MDGWAWWLLLLGIGVGIGLAWLATGRLAQDEHRARTVERREEAEWISRTIGARGGVAPPLLVEEVLELHRGWAPEESAPAGHPGAGADGSRWGPPPA